MKLINLKQCELKEVLHDERGSPNAFIHVDEEGEEFFCCADTPFVVSVTSEPLKHTKTGFFARERKVFFRLSGEASKLAELYEIFAGRCTKLSRPTAAMKTIAVRQKLFANWYHTIAFCKEATNGNP